MDPRGVHAETRNNFTAVTRMQKVVNSLADNSFFHDLGPSIQELIGLINQRIGALRQIGGHDVVFERMVATVLAEENQGAANMTDDRQRSGRLNSAILLIRKNPLFNDTPAYVSICNLLTAYANLPQQ